MQSKCYNWIIILFFNGIIQLTISAQLRCYKTTRNNYLTIDLNNPTVLLNSSCFDYNLPTVCYTFGYRGRANGPATTAVLNTYLETRKRNVLLLDWESEARSDTLGIQLGYVMHAVPNAKKVGEDFGRTLTMLAEAGLNMSDVHLIGHSLGAHLMAHAGRYSRARGQPVSRITGLDPARTLFEGMLTMQKGLDRTCAKFVDVIHTNPGKYGTEKPAGTVDLWPNYAYNEGKQPGCPEGKYPMFSSEDLCSHDRAWMYYVESIKNGTAFPAASANSYESWLELEEGRTNTSMYLGDLTNTRASGNFYLTTNQIEPFSKGKEGLLPNNQARKRRTTTSYKTTFVKIFGFFR